MKARTGLHILPSRLGIRLLFVVCGVVGVVTAVSASGVNPQRDPAVSASAYNDDSEHFDVVARDGYIYVYTPRNVTIQLYTILGQLVVNQEVQSGTTRIKAPSRGVFIVKAGSITRRVTVN